MKSQRALSLLASIMISGSAVANTEPLDPRTFNCHPSESDPNDFSRSAVWHMQQYEDRIELSEITIAYSIAPGDSTFGSEILWLVGEAPDFILKNSARTPKLWESSHDDFFYYTIELPPLSSSEVVATVTLERKINKNPSETVQSFTCWSSR